MIKNIVIIIVVLIVLLGVIFLLLPKHTSTKPIDTIVKIILIDPQGVITIPSFTYLPNSLDISTFIDSSVTKYLPYQPLWDLITVNDIPVSISNGVISDTRLVTSFILSGALIISGKFQHTCIISDIPTCNPCNGEVALCTSTGWVCTPKQKCPTGESLLKCCLDPDKPFASCVGGGPVQCTTCVGSITCNPCNGEVSFCTSTGWICKPDEMCPTGQDLYNCCHSDKPYATCQIGEGVQCGSCPDPVPECNVCNGEVPVCTATGWICKAGEMCPSGELLYNCCPSDKPYATCQIGQSVQCTNVCPDPVPNCNVCDGEAPFCTATGWICKAGEMCPSGELLYDCCPSDKPYATCQIGQSVQCTNVCPDPVPNCNVCNGEVATCGPTGWFCKPNQMCPSGEQLYGCCSTGTPFAKCTIGGPVSCSVCIGDKPTCNVCLGEQLICTSTGWICKAGEMCPSGELLYDCCPPNNPYATCQIGQRVQCGTCPDPVPHCNVCNGEVATCGPTGWFCKPDQMCPSGEQLYGCCSPPTSFTQCTIGGPVNCSTCIKDQPTCNVCLGEQAICTGTGWVCKAGQMCPTGEDLYKCCTDPSKPFATCNVGGPVVCSTCTDPPPVCNACSH